MSFVLTIRRGPSLDTGTFSYAEITDGSKTIGWDWMELPWRDNLPGKSCIYCGTYRAETVESPHFGRKVYRLLFVPGRTDVEIHPANWAGNVDLGLHTDLLGCMAPGRGIGELAPPGMPLQKALLKSTPAFDELMEFTGGAPIEVRVIAFGAVGPAAN